MKKYSVVVILLAGLFFLASFCFGGSKSIKLQTGKDTSQNISLLKEAKHSLTLAHEFLLKSQLENGSWKNEPAITALVLYSFMLRPRYNPDDRSEQALRKGFAYLETFVKPDGGIYRNEYKSYTTAVCLLAFTESNLEKYKPVINNAKGFLIQFQVDETDGISKDHKFYGGIGYGGDDRPDLSNTQLALEAIKAAEDYEARYRQIIPGNTNQVEIEEKELGVHWRKALVFLARCQNVKTVNDMPYAEDDGGFIYETGHYKPERSHSYGSMTYAGVKSLVYARVDRDDIRVTRAVSWIRSHYTLEENPGFGTAALYYYYMTFAKCLDALGEEVIVDDKGTKHYWREDVIKKLISLQHEEGYWVNPDARYWQNIKDLVTAYSIIGMKFALKGMLSE
jgi:squalene-hopene/tetraprenyl-beta-curcumene cyclase